MDITATIDEGIGWITLNRPQLRNAISRQMWDAIPKALNSLKEAGAKVIIFRGEGYAFASGADLTELSAIGDSEERAREFWVAISTALNTVATFELPTIAMIVGPCMGGGCLLATACDLRYCDSTAKFAIPIAQLGIFIDKANTARLVSLVGRGVATEILLTGNIIAAQRAQEIGLVNAMFPLVQLERMIVAIAEDIKRNVSSSIFQSKRAIAEVCEQLDASEDDDPVVASYLSQEFRDRVTKALARNR